MRSLCHYVRALVASLACLGAIALCVAVIVVGADWETQRIAFSIGFATFAAGLSLFFAIASQKAVRRSQQQAELAAERRHEELLAALRELGQHHDTDRPTCRLLRRLQGLRDRGVKVPSPPPAAGHLSAPPVSTAGHKLGT